jgi:hypothetical protein
MWKATVCCGVLSYVHRQHVSGCFSILFVYLPNMARRREHDDEQVVCLKTLEMKIYQTLVPVTVVMK